MRRLTWCWLALFGAGCGSDAVDKTQDSVLEDLGKANEALAEADADLDRRLTEATTALAASNQAIADLQQVVADLRAHERALAEEVVGGAPFDEVLAFQGQLEPSRIDSLGAPELATLTARVVANEASLTALTDHERALAAEVTGKLPVDSVLTDFQGQLVGSRIDLCVTDDGLDERGYATIAYVDAQDAVERARVDMEDYATNADVIAADAAERQWVVGQGYVTLPDLAPLATDADLAALAGRVSTIEGDYLRDGDLDPYATDADLAALADRVSMIEGDYLQAADLAPYATQTWVAANYPEQADFDDAVATLDDHEARLDALEAADLPTRMTHVESRVSDLELRPGGYARVISADTTILVPTDAPDIQAALDALQDAVIDASATVKIEVEPAGCGAIYTAPIVARHRDGAQVHIVSQSADPAQCALRFQGTSAGLVVDAGYTLGRFAGFTVQGEFGAHVGVHVREAAALLDATPLVITQWADQGLVVDGLSYAFAYGLDASDNGGAGVQASYGALARVEAATCNANGADGVVAFYGGAVAAASASLTDNAGRGAFAWDRGTVYANDLGSSGNGGAGVEAQSGAWVSAGGGTVTDNGGSGVVATHLSGVYFGSGLTTGNQDGVFASDGSYVAAASVQALSNRGYGLIARLGAILGADFGVANGNGDSGFWSATGSVITADWSTATNNGGHGLSAAGGAVISAEGTHALDNGGSGVAAQWGSTVLAAESTFEDNDHHGGVVQYNSTLFAQHCRIANNGASASSWSGVAAQSSFADVRESDIIGNESFGVDAQELSFVFAYNTTINSNPDFGIRTGVASDVQAQGAGFSGNGADFSGPVGAPPSWIER